MFIERNVEINIYIHRKKIIYIMAEYLNKDIVTVQIGKNVAESKHKIV